MIENKNIIITGAFQGIGKETVSVFAKNKANVLACSIPIKDEIKKKEFETFCDDLKSQNNVNIYKFYFDMLDIEQIKNVILEIKKLNIPLDGIVNIAGINRDANFGMITESDMMDTFKVNVFSQIIFTQYIVRLMKKQIDAEGIKSEKSIVFTSSVAALDGNVGQTTYAASKAALIGAVKCMAKELGQFGIRVNAVAPGVIKSPMTDKLPKELIDIKKLTMDVGEIGMPIDVANVYKFLMSDLSSHITGQVLRVDGGM